MDVVFPSLLGVPLTRWLQRCSQASGLDELGVEDHSRSVQMGRELTVASSPKFTSQDQARGHRHINPQT